MKSNPFDEALMLRRNLMTEQEIAAVVDVNDTLGFAKASAESIFGKAKVTPNAVIAIASLMLARLPAEMLKKLNR